MVLKRHLVVVVIGAEARVLELCFGVSVDHRYPLSSLSYCPLEPLSASHRGRL